MIKPLFNFSSFITGTSHGLKNEIFWPCLPSPSIYPIFCLEGVLEQTSSPKCQAVPISGTLSIHTVVENQLWMYLTDHPLMPINIYELRICVWNSSLGHFSPARFSSLAGPSGKPNVSKPTVVDQGLAFGPTHHCTPPRYCTLSSLWLRAVSLPYKLLGLSQESSRQIMVLHVWGKGAMGF